MRERCVAHMRTTATTKQTSLHHVCAANAQVPAEPLAALVCMPQCICTSHVIHVDTTQDVMSLYRHVILQTAVHVTVEQPDAATMQQ
jgi:uncharacterized protein involved in cysteine biosynthesis